jgi:hypothetical protein
MNTFEANLGTTGKDMQDLEKRLNEEKEAFQTQLNAATRARDEFQQTNIQLQHERDPFEKANIGLQQERDNFQRTGIQLQHERDAFQQTNIQLQQERDTFGQRIIRLEQERYTAIAEENSIEPKIKAVASFQRDKDLRRVLKSQRRKKKTSKRSIVFKRGWHCDADRRALQESRKSNARLTNDISSLNEKIIDNARERQNSEASKTAVQHELEALCHKVEFLDKQNKELAEDNERLQTFTTPPPLSPPRDTSRSDSYNCGYAGIYEEKFQNFNDTIAKTAHELHQAGVRFASLEKRKRKEKASKQDEINSLSKILDEERQTQKQELERLKTTIRDPSDAAVLRFYHRGVSTIDATVSTITEQLDKEPEAKSGIDLEVASPKESNDQDIEIHSVGTDSDPNLDQNPGHFMGWNDINVTLEDRTYGADGEEDLGDSSSTDSSKSVSEIGIQQVPGVVDWDEVDTGEPMSFPNPSIVVTSIPSRIAGNVLKFVLPSLNKCFSFLLGILLVFIPYGGYMLCRSMVHESAGWSSVRHVAHEQPEVSDSYSWADTMVWAIIAVLFYFLNSVRRKSQFGY